MPAPTACEQLVKASMPEGRGRGQSEEKAAINDQQVYGGNEQRPGCAASRTCHAVRIARLSDSISETHITEVELP